MGVPLMDLRGQWEPLHDRLTAAVGEVIRSGVFILGPNVKAFEEEAAADLGVDHAVDRKSTRLNSSHEWISRMPSSA